ncbi:hypothetical protein [Halocatena pleomorpha]|uniref:Uncharacterized protein n=1 Tax=Halocatena pleomorpha TaxID=1785090 RepID=A0A3P3RKQ2_9EURY|nr:hypothetical protein [Halocatena pleomorpha]RRJ33440.1 hypothetical protein EIK79_01140 [Halocatena pleomorpha]
MSDESALQNIRNGFAKIDQLVTLWIALMGAITFGLTTVLSVTLINEPFRLPLYASGLLTACATFIIYFSNSKTEPVLRFGWTTALVFAVLAMVNGSLDAPTSGSLYYIVTALLSWIAALAIGCVAVWTDDWRELRPWG